MAKLEAAGYVEIDKTFADKKPRTVYRLTKTGRAEVEQYRATIDELLSGLGG